MNILSRMEELILLSVWKLQGEAYGLQIRTYLSELVEQELSVGAVYVPLKRLKKRGYLSSWDSDPTDERGGRTKRFYKLTEKGVTALQQVKTVQENAWSGLPDLGLGWNPSI
ncbi:MAG: PadR family transcriptional regulator [Balneolaceae bacterium]|nr:PadR family transcriptional regulator [Balneolaceae bacterium]MBO6545385.1 PadR family transcriptional regulator [Balneolaceae bacterium]MBO6646781.1 PadR family transcriptional regulator [Balneolaceae bacterium]